MVGVGDGANGLREEMAAHFPNFRYVLDRTIDATAFATSTSPAAPTTCAASNHSKLSQPVIIGAMPQ